MMKNKKVILCVIIGILSCIYLVGCKENKKVESSSYSASSSSTLNSLEKKEKDSAESSSESPSLAAEPKVEEPEETIAKSMSLEEKVAQLFFGRAPTTGEIEVLQQFPLGGYMLFGSNVESETPTSLRQKIQNYQHVSAVPLFIAADEEGGTVTRISRNPGLVSEKFLSPQELFQAGGYSTIEEDTKRKDEILHSYGINVNLGPVADISQTPTSFIYERSIGLDAVGTASYIEKVVGIMKQDKIGSCLKHFPGYGDNLDSHYDSVRDLRSWEIIEKNDLVPFKAGIQAGADSVLVSHNIIENLDPTQPASLSPAVHQILRDKLAFSGVIVADDFDMIGVTKFVTQEEAAVRALESGNDMILSSTFSSQIPYVIAAVKEGRLSEARIDESLMRVLKWKKNLGLI